MLRPAPRRGLDAIGVAPTRRRVGFDRRADPKHDIDAAAVASFLRGLLRHLRAKVIVARDGRSNHKGPVIRELPRLYPARLPLYASDLNSEEMPWRYL